MLSRLLAVTATLGLAFSLLSPQAAGQAYKKHEFPTHGLKLDLGRTYEWLAIQPLYVATRVFLYGVGCRCRGVPIGLGPKSPF